MSDRFDFEQQIIKCWGVTDDIKEVSEHFLNYHDANFTKDKVANTLNGLVELYDMKFNKLWDLFEEVHMNLVRDERMAREDADALRQQLIFETQGYGAGGKPKNSGAGQPSLFGVRTDVDEDGFAVIKPNKKGKK